LAAEIRIRRIGPQDIQQVLAIQNACPQAASFGENDFLGPDPIRFTLVAELNSAIKGFLIAQAVQDELEILNLAVLAEHRRSGIASRLLHEALRQSSASAQRVYLEVRESNAPAIAFYARFEFREVGRRKGYYSNPVEDALVLAYERTGPPP
jgi:ribosomal-protein-alanine acetyltransferase